MPDVIISDSSPVILLVNVQLIHLLPDMFGQVTIPVVVQQELLRLARPLAVRELIESRPAWLNVRETGQTQTIAGLDPGEAAAILLAQELSPSLLLIDEVKGRREASARGIPIVGTIGLLLLAAEEQRIDLREVFDRVKQTDFWFSHKELDRLLERFLSQRKTR